MSLTREAGTKQPATISLAKTAFKKVALGVAGAVGAGVLVGVLARVFMRVVSVATGVAGEFTWSGSFSIVVVYVVAVFPVAVTAAITTRKWRWIMGAAGAMFLTVPGVAIASEEIGEADSISAVQWVGVTAASIAVFSTIILAPIVAVRLVDWMSRRERPMTTRYPSRR